MTIYVAETKVYWKSKTFWANVAGLIGGFLLVLQGEILAGTTLSTANVINLILRFVTKNGVSLSQ